MRLMMLLVVALLAMLALAQPGVDGKGAGKGKREAPKQVTLTGTVKDYTASVKAKAARGMGEITCTLVTDAGEMRLGLAPAAFLTKLGLTLKDGAKITVNGLQGANRPLIAVIDVTLDGKTYTLRDAKGQPLWGPFDDVAVTTLQGTVIEVITETPKAKAADAKPVEGDAAKATKALPAQVTLLLQTDKDAVKILLGPDAALTKLGYVPAKDQKIAVTGWLQTQGKKGRAALTAQSVTVAAKTYTLRDGKGQPVWNKADGNKARGGKGGKAGKDTPPAQDA